jgi:GNAT superfamily N-acetyltransferase
MYAPLNLNRSPGAVPGGRMRRVRARDHDPADVRIRRFEPDDWREFRQVRLEALQDAPTAFGSTYEWSLTRVEADWRRRLAGSAMFGAMLPETGPVPVGIAGGFVEQPEPSEPPEPPGDPDAAVAGAVVELVSMWVRPGMRGRKIGSSLIDAVVAWAAAGGAREVHLWVTDGNDPARRLYERCGFVLTGEREPLESFPSLTELGMVRPL